MQTIPLAERRYDLAFIAFFAINLAFITYVIDLEQLVIVDPAHFTYPVWPPRAIIDALHWWGHTYDPALLARQPWWRATIWIDVIAFGPFYVFAIYAFIKGRNWIRVPSLVWAGMMFTNVTVILSEELHGQYASPRFAVVLAANLSWLLMPLAVVARLAWRDRPFTKESS